MGGNKRLVSRVAGLVLLASLALSLVAGANTGAPLASAAAPNSKSAANAATPETLVIKVYFEDNAERDKLAVELGAEEVATTGGFLTVLADRALYNKLVAQGLRVEIDKEQTAHANDPHLWDTFFSGYKTVEEMQTFLDQKVAAYPNLAEKIDIGDSWCKSHAGQCTQPAPNNGY